MKEKYYILSCSFGKDSLYLLNYIIENNLPLDEVQFIEPMFNNNISGLNPKSINFINYVINRFNNINFNIIKSDSNYRDLYLKYGVPTFRGCHWCTGWLKTKPLKKYNKKLEEDYEVFYYIGFCSNEKERVIKCKNKNYIFPLYDNNINENMCFNWCKDNNLLNPCYSSRTFRDGCWFCPFQSKLQWFLLKIEFPNLFNLMCDLEITRYKINSNYSLVRNKPLNDYINGYLQINIFDLLESEV